MSKQQFELGEKVHVFKMQNNEPVKAQGTITVAEINSGGYIQYSVVCVNQADGMWQTNHASTARTEEELNQKIANYMEYITEQKKIYEAKFGKPEF